MVSSDVSGDVEREFGINLPLALTIASFTALAWCYALELNVRVWMTFKRFQGLYFWSLQAAAFGVILHAVAFIVKFFHVTDVQVPVLIIITIGWWCMVTGQSLVLYSRLHLLVVDARRLRWVLVMICVDAFLFHTPTTILTFGSNLTTIQAWKDGFSVMEKIQMTAFSTQEFIISILYIWETRKMLKPRESFQKERVRKVMRHLIYVNILIIFLDITLLACEYANLYEIEATMKPAIYAFKLRLEFPILNQLTNILCRGDQPISDGYHRSTSNDNDVRMGSVSRPGVLGSASQRAYSVFAGKNMPSETGNADGGIKATTEVTVHHTGNRSQNKQGITFYEDRVSSRPGISPQVGYMSASSGESPTSSEIEFAKSATIGSQNT